MRCLVAQSTKIVASVLRQQANAALAAQRKAEQAVQDAKRRADTAVANQQSKVASLESEVTRLQAQLSSAKSTAKHLAKARKVGLAQAALERKLARERAARAAAARRAAERAAAERAAAEQSSSDSSGGSGRVVSVGAPARGTTAGAARAIAYARKQLGKPYLYAADGPAAFDCSGLTMRAWQAGGVSLPHWSVAQYEQSQPVSAGDARPGDLVFFASNPADYRTIYHVGLYIGGGMMIEAPHTGDVVKIYAVYPERLPRLRTTLTQALSANGSRRRARAPRPAPAMCARPSRTASGGAVCGSTHTLLRSFVEHHPRLRARRHRQRQLAPREASTGDSFEAVVPGPGGHGYELARRKPVRSTQVHLGRVDIEQDLMSVDLPGEPRMDAHPDRHALPRDDREPQVQPVISGAPLHGCGALERPPGPRSVCKATAASSTYPTSQRVSYVVPCMAWASPRIGS